MKTLIYFFSTNKMKMLVLSIMALSLMSFRLFMSNPLGPGCTGSPCDGNSSCTNCHSDFAPNSGGATFSITSNISSCGYTPGNTYLITTTISQAGFNYYQFELSPQKDTSCVAFGTLTAGASTQIQTSGGFEYITANNIISTNSWTFSWTAPAVGMGTGTFYAAFIAADSSGDETGDYCYNSSYTVQQSNMTEGLTLIQDTVNPLLWYGYDTITGGTLPYSYFWDFGDNTTSTLAFPTHTYAVAGYYQICATVTDANGCNTTTCDSTYRIISPGLMQYFAAIDPLASVNFSSNNNSQFSIYPNPFSSATIIQTNIPLQNATLSIYNLNGQRVNQLKNISGRTITLQRDNLKSGFYFLQLTQDDKILMTDKLVIRDE